MSIPSTADIKTRSVWIFFALTYFLTWIFWIPLALSGQDVMNGPLMIALVLGGFGPSIAGIVMTYRTQDYTGRRDFWRRSINFKQIGGGWYVVILLIFPLVYGLAILLDMLLGGSTPGAEAVAQIAAQPASLIGMLLMGLVIGPLAEEFGWRGFALDPLQSRWSTLVSALIVGGFWWAWHFPLFFMNGMLQNEWGVGTMAFWSYAVTVFSLSVLFTWVFNNTRRSILAAILLHFMFNSTLNVVSPISDRVSLIVAGFLALLAVVVIFIWGAKTLVRPKS
ncbi:type II CAAX prenyl endopeptidase Rce1 family protein [Chloroflexota bacterium]